MLLAYLDHRIQHNKIEFYQAGWLDQVHYTKTGCAVHLELNYSRYQAQFKLPLYTKYSANVPSFLRS